MGRSTSAGKIEWLPLAIHGGAFLQFIMKDFGYGLDSGIILVADDDTQARQFVVEYCQKASNGEQISSWKKRRKYPPNYCCGFMTVKKTASEYEVEDFLDEKGFLPIVVCGGVFPEFLKVNHYVFRLRGTDLESVRAMEFSSEVEAFKAYVIEEIDEICKMLRKLRNSIAIAEYDGEEDFHMVYNFFIAVGAVYASYLRKTRTEREVVDFFEGYRRETLTRLSQINDFASGEMLKEVVNSLVWEYLSGNNDVVVADTNRLHMKAGKAIEAEKAVLFDDEFYFISPKLCMKICHSLLETVSETELKRRLKEEDIISCNSADYTVKKNIINVCGITERPRFIRIYKEILLSPDNLRLEDVFYEEEEEEYAIRG